MKFFKLIIILFIFSVQKGNAGNIYDDIFTSDIYNISKKEIKEFEEIYYIKEVKESKTAEEVARQEERRLARKAWECTTKYNSPEDDTIATLYFHKFLCVKERIVVHLQNEIDFLEQLRSAKEGPVTSIVKTLGSTLSQFSTSYSLFSVGTKLFGEFLNTIMKNKDKEVLTTAEIDKIIIKLKTEKDKLYEGVINEPINDLEERYVLLKSKNEFPKDLQNSIEGHLINSRKPSYHFYYLKECVENSLNLPHTHKVIEHQMIGPLFKEFIKEEYFGNYSSTTKERMKGILVDLVTCSQLKRDSLLPLRRTYYLYGGAGAGKSSAVEKLATLLGLPCYKATVRGKEDLITDNIEGTDPLSTKSTPGWLSRALLEFSKPGGSTYKNAILLLDDFDRVLLDPKSGPTSLSFFLDYLDPLKTSFYSPYFKAKMDISRMHIFVTANHPIPDEYEYDAIKERFSNIIKFDNMDPTKILNTQFDLVAKSYGIILPKNEKQKTQFIDQFIESAKKCAENEHSIRSLKKELCNLAADYIAIKNENNWKNKIKQREKEINDRKKDREKKNKSERELKELKKEIRKLKYENLLFQRTGEEKEQNNKRKNGSSDTESASKRQKK